MENLKLEVKKLETRDTKATCDPCFEYYWKGICLELGWTITLPCC